MGQTCHKTGLRMRYILWLQLIGRRQLKRFFLIGCETEWLRGHGIRKSHETLPETALDHILGEE